MQIPDCLKASKTVVIFPMIIYGIHCYASSDSHGTWLGIAYDSSHRLIFPIYVIIYLSELQPHKLPYSGYTEYLKC